MRYLAALSVLILCGCSATYSPSLTEYRSQNWSSFSASLGMGKVDYFPTRGLGKNYYTTSGGLFLLFMPVGKRIDIKIDELAFNEFSRVLNTRRIIAEPRKPICILDADVYKVMVNKFLPAETIVRYTLAKNGKDLYKAKIENRSINPMTWVPNTNSNLKISDAEGQFISDMLHKNLDELLDAEPFRRVLDKECL